MAKSTATLKIAPLSPEEAKRGVVIDRPKFETATLKIQGTSPYVQNAFSRREMDKMMATQMAGSVAKKGTKRAPKDFEASYEAAMHRSKEGWIGIPAPAFRNGSISACRIVGFKMTLAKLSVFVEADGFDVESGEPLVRITKGEPRQHFAQVRNANGGTDIRCRPMWSEGWEASVRVRWDADQFSASDVYNLFARVGAQVGVGEGRADSRASAGMGWGHFQLL